jgi:hypothetical protein
MKFLLNLGGHQVKLRENKAIDNPLLADHREHWLAIICDWLKKMAKARANQADAVQSAY